VGTASRSSLTQHSLLVLSPHSQIVALLPDGKPFWKSSIFDGACSGTPVVGEDGTLVYFTRNTATTGSFTILSAGLNGTAYFNNFTEPRPFAPPGIYHSPTEGYYLGGDGNSNDIVIFSNTAFYGETTVGVGSLFAFQSPLFGEPPSVTLLNNATTWYSFSPPKITNNGYSMYIPVSRSQFRAWVGAAGDNLNQFHRLPTATIQFPRGNPAWLAPYASVALSSSPTKPMVFGGTAAYLMVGYTFDMKEMWKVASTSNIRAEAKVSPQDDRVYWVEENSKVHCTNTTSGSEIWAIQLSFAPVRSDFAQTSDGSSLFFTDVAGNLIALSVAVAPSHAPTTQAVGTPSKAPSTSPTTAFPTNVPISSAPSTAPSTVALVTQAPILGASAAPSVDTPVPTVPPTTGSIARTLVPTGSKTQVTTSEKLSGAGVKATYSCVAVFFAFLLF